MRQRPRLVIDLVSPNETKRPRLVIDLVSPGFDVTQLGNRYILKVNVDTTL